MCSRPAGNTSAADTGCGATACPTWALCRAARATLASSARSISQPWQPNSFSACLEGSLTHTLGSNHTSASTGGMVLISCNQPVNRMQSTTCEDIRGSAWSIEASQPAPAPVLGPSHSKLHPLCLALRREGKHGKRGYLHGWPLPACGFSRAPHSAAQPAP